VKQGDVGEKQLFEQRGKPKVYWLAYKPPRVASTPSDETKGIDSHQTLSGFNVFGENQSEGSNERLWCERQTYLEDDVEGAG
jgi:hypothetical protein